MAWNKGRKWPGTRPGNGLEQGLGMAWNKGWEWPGTRAGNDREQGLGMAWNKSWERLTYHSDYSHKS